ncbi:MAG TPA: mammalian cell entry protein [Burkholderiales bacterium]|nr:mammalian cell entry protein [Burkholderiales bacterium]
MDRDSAQTSVPKGLQFRVGLLVGLAVVLGTGFVLYALYARGVFEDDQQLTLIAENGEGVSVGMDLTFSGFPIGRVKRLALDELGRARIEIDVPRKDAHWLRQTTIFTLERGIVGSTRIRAYTANLSDAPLPDDAVRNVLRGDTSEEIPRMVATLRSTLENVEQMTGTGGNLQLALADVRSVTARAAGQYGVLGMLLGNEEEAKKLVATLDRANALLMSVDSLVGRTDKLVLKTEERLFSQGGAIEGTEKAVEQLNSVLTDVRASLKRADQILADAEVTSANAKEATTDLVRLRADVDANVRKISNLIDEINKKWPYQQKPDIRLP